MAQNPCCESGSLCEKLLISGKQADWTETLRTSMRALRKQAIANPALKDDFAHGSKVSPEKKSIDSLKRGAPHPEAQQKLPQLKCHVLVLPR